ncbi:Degenerin mec-10 [Nymphon striatum]|nr:Degenerin mec-10 [Nymphon striatum]
MTSCPKCELLDVDEASAKIKKNKKKQKEDKAKSRRKILWRIVFLFSLVGFTYQSYQFLKEYLSNPVVITGYVQTGVPQNFPSITVCSYSKKLNEILPDTKPVRLADDGLNNMSCDWNKKYFQKRYDRMKLHKSKYCKIIPTPRICMKQDKRRKTTRRFKSVDFKPKAVPIPLPVKFCKKIHNNVQIIDTLSANYESDLIENNNITKITMKRQSTLIPNEVSNRNFTHSYTYKYGNCWNFDPENEDGEPSKALEAGPMFGLNLDLYFDKSTTIELLDRIIGFRLSVHNRGEVPFPEDQGLDISLQKQTSVGIYSSSKRWLPPPYYSNCIDKDPSQYFKPEYFNSTKRIYTTQTVSKESYGENVNVLMPYLYFHGSRYDGQVCDVDNQTEICCMEQVIGSLRHGINCNCTIPCQEQLGRVKVFFESLDTRIDIILPKYQLADVFSNIGGQVGLWLGISLVALYEVGENFIISLYERIKSSGSRKR